MTEDGVQDTGLENQAPEDEHAAKEETETSQGEIDDANLSEADDDTDDSYDDENGDEDSLVAERRDSEYDRKRKRRANVMGEAVLCRPLEVIVRDDRVEQAIRQLKNRMAREGVLRELKNRRHYFKPSELKRIKSREAARRRRKQARQKGAH